MTYSTMEKLVLVLAEAGIELVPQKLWRHPAVRSSAARRGKKPSEILLDVSLHHHAMLGLRDREKRGRPDITHVCLLVALSSMLNRVGLLDVHVYTYRGVWIGVSRETRLPRNYNRFVGLIEQLLLRGKVPPDSDRPLLWARRSSFKEGLRKISGSRVVLLDEKGTAIHPRNLGRVLTGEKRPVVVVGAFQRGDFSREIKESANDIVSIAPFPLDAWAVVARVIASVEDELNVYGKILNKE